MSFACRCVLYLRAEKEKEGAFGAFAGRFGKGLEDLLLPLPV